MKNYIILLKETYKILPKKSRKKIFLIFIALAFSGLLEALSLGLLVPLISEILGTSKDFFSLKSFLGVNILSKQSIITYIITLILFVYFIKAVYLTFLEFYLQKFLINVKNQITTKLFKKYTYDDYENNVNRNSSILFRNLTSEVSNFSAGVIEPVIMLAKEFFIISIILIMILTIDFKISIFIIFFSLIFVTILKNLLGNKLEKLGLSEQKLKGVGTKIMLETLQGIKFVKSYGLEELFNNKLIKHLKEFTKIKSRSTSLRLLPRIWAEFTTISVLIIFGFLFVHFGYSISEYLLFSSIFLISMIKVMPSLLSGLRVLNLLSNYKASINLINKEFAVDKNKIDQLSEGVLEFSEKFECKNIAYKYLNSKEILNDVSFEINRNNDVIGIFGESGSGKTTLVDILIGLLKPNSGFIYLDGKKANISDYKNIFGYVPQTTFLFDDTIKNNILLTQYNKQSDISEKILHDVLEKTQLLDLVNSLKDKENTYIGENGAKLSGGQKQRIGIARALIHNPKILILDEATSGLDKETEKKIYNDLQIISKKLSIIIVSHNPTLWTYCNKLYEMKNKHLIKIK